MSEEKYPHKFISNNNEGTYNQVVFCEKCGMIAFHSNNTKFVQGDRQKETMETPCPYPDKKKEEVL